LFLRASLNLRCPLETGPAGPIFASRARVINDHADVKERNMNLIYNSEQYSVVEFGADNGLEALRFGGYEIMDKSGKREIFIGGTLARSFREEVENLIASEPSIEEIDDFLGKYDALMRQPVTLH
jgi:hypothetical protein